MKKGWELPNLFFLYISVSTLFVIQPASAVRTCDCGCFNIKSPINSSAYFLPLSHRASVGNAG